MFAPRVFGHPFPSAADDRGVMADSGANLVVIMPLNVVWLGEDTLC